MSLSYISNYGDTTSFTHAICILILITREFVNLIGHAISLAYQMSQHQTLNIIQK